MREMKDSGVEWIGEIPKDWNICKLKNVSSIQTGSTPTKTEQSMFYSDVCGIPWLKAEDLGKNYSITRAKEYLTEEGAKEGRIFPANTVYVCCIASIGKTGYSEQECSCNQQINGIVFNRMQWKYGYYMTLAQESEYIFNASGNVMKIINTEKQANLMCPLPPICDQQKIANYLDSKCSQIDSIIEKQQAIIEKLKEYKLSVITEAVTKGLNPDAEMKDSGGEFVGYIPKHWSVAKLGSLFDFIGGFAFNSEMYVAESNNQVVRIGNVKNGYMPLNSNPVYVSDDIAEQASKYLIKPDNILFTMTGTKGKRDYFFTHVVTEKDCENKRLYVNQRVGCFVARNGVYPQYYGYLLKDSRILDGIFLHETGTANQGNLGIDSISRTLVHVPPIDEQIEIGKYLINKCREIDMNIEGKTSIIEKLKEYKKSLIYEVVTGKKEV